jgi:hypothetical protein
MVIGTTFLSASDVDRKIQLVLLSIYQPRRGPSIFMKNYSTRFALPECVVDYLRKGDLEDHHYHHYGSARAVRWMEMAIDQIKATDDQVVAEYHTYAGISAARTAIDALASWLNVRLALYPKPSTQIDLAKADFRHKVRAAIETKGNLTMLPHFDALGELAHMQIDPYRQRAQHREGLAIVRYSTGEWYIAPQGLQHPRSEDQKITDLLENWAAEITEHL